MHPSTITRSTTAPDDDPAWRPVHTSDGDVLTLEEIAGDAPVDLAALHHTLDALWAETRTTTLRIPLQLADRLPLTRSHWTVRDDHLEIARPAFYQIREAWLAPALWPVMPETHVAAACPGGRHPVRPRIEDGVVYRKRLAATGETFTLRRAEPARDGARFHRWQNDPRVAPVWEEGGPRAKTDAYLASRRDDPHTEALIGAIDGVPFAYIEPYWAREDRIGPHYDVDDHDLGFHALVGEADYLGRTRTVAWMKAVSHFLFLLDPRTHRLVGEPAADNDKMIERAEAAGYRGVKAFDFPHKRALLMMLERATFFQEHFP